MSRNIKKVYQARNNDKVCTQLSKWVLELASVGGHLSYWVTLLQGRIKGSVSAGLRLELRPSNDTTSFLVCVHGKNPPWPLYLSMSQFWELSGGNIDLQKNPTHLSLVMEIKFSVASKKNTKVKIQKEILKQLYLQVLGRRIPKSLWKTL